MTPFDFLPLRRIQYDSQVCKSAKFQYEPEEGPDHLEYLGDFCLLPLDATVPIACDDFVPWCYTVTV